MVLAQEHALIQPTHEASMSGVRIGEDDPEGDLATGAPGSNTTWDQARRSSPSADIFKAGRRKPRGKTGHRARTGRRRGIALLAGMLVRRRGGFHHGGKVGRNTVCIRRGNFGAAGTRQCTEHQHSAENTQRDQPRGRKPRSDNLHAWSSLIIHCGYRSDRTQTNNVCVRSDFGSGMAHCRVRNHDRQLLTPRRF